MLAYGLFAYRFSITKPVGYSGVVALNSEGFAETAKDVP